MIKREELTNPKSCMSRAQDDEMTFVLLARDRAAPAAIKAWVAERIRLGKNHPLDEQIREAEACADKMIQYQQTRHLGVPAAEAREPEKENPCK
jgi:hypothetical protein